MKIGVDSAQESVIFDAVLDYKRVVLSYNTHVHKLQHTCITPYRRFLHVSCSKTLVLPRKPFQRNGSREACLTISWLGPIFWRDLGKRFRVVKAVETQQGCSGNAAEMLSKCNGTWVWYLFGNWVLQLPCFELFRSSARGRRFGRM